ncbi:DUF6586 family protein [Parahaliea aestuarii]|uniref:Uncharacterized protein n=1 Tax=Parahaliea aestuarii TaxID=1852021 RepID=A0A5C8ZXK0_9GAMM|nr:DUF6586 family protein [Parahaliea aestuarii]TXS93178.1 hypothetical protein FVW59_04820 [Parahaliea aestuarii]
MSSPRGLANHHLYLARLVLTAWQRDAAAAEVPAGTLVAAFGPACHQHLLRAYGWFLLAISSPAEVPTAPPTRVSELPPPPQGRAVPAELREFQLLESEGWLADLVNWSAAEPVAARRSFGNLATASQQPAGPQRFSEWVQGLDECFARMGDSLDEY